MLLTSSLSGWAAREIPRFISCSQKPATGHSSIQDDPVHTLPFYLFQRISLYTPIWAQAFLVFCFLQVFTYAFCIFLHLILLIIFYVEFKLLNSSFCSFLLFPPPPVTSAHRYISQRAGRKHPKSMCFPWCQRSSFRTKLRFLYILIFTLPDSKEPG